MQVRSDWTLALCTGAERLKSGNGKKLHPTQKPEALLARVILSASRPDDLVLDPFCGTGTTGAVAKRLGRRFIGIERDESYAKAAQKRIAAVVPLAAASLAPFMTAREAPRVPFAALIERGLVMPGARLCDAKRRVKALVRADGAIALGTVGSIHRSARWRRVSKPATAGPSGTWRRRRAWSRSTRCARSSGRRWGR